MPSLRAVVPALAVLGLAACEGGAADEAPPIADAPAAEGAAGPREVVVNARDFAFDLADTVEAGAIRFRLVNQGPELHHVQLVRLEQGRTFSDLMSAMSSGHPPSWVTWMGGPNAPVPGEEASATVELEPGEYALLCVIPSSDGVPHMAKGMARPLTVVPATSETSVPQADIVMRLVDYDFETDATLTPGRHTLRIENPAQQPHEVIVAQLASGRTMADLMGWLEGGMVGQPPGKAIGGITGIAPGAVNYVTLDLQEGEYVLLCLVPDAGDGRVHAAHGMARQITVAAPRAT